jgi:predicted nuclease with RNAse H fold
LVGTATTAQEPAPSPFVLNWKKQGEAMAHLEKLVGIDFGSKLAGSTVICSYYKGRLHFDASKIREDADAFITKKLGLLSPELVFMDAPLSLPGRYSGRENFVDYFYREADRELGAMSPMFIGGLTARAIRLKDWMTTQGMMVFETYPSYEAKLLELDGKMYKGDEKHLPHLALEVSEKSGLQVPLTAITDWHHFDALLAFVAGMRYMNGQHRAIGKEEEGIIYV